MKQGLMGEGAELNPDKEVSIVNIISEKESFSHSLHVHPGQKVFKYNMAGKTMEVVTLRDAKLVENRLLPGETDIHYTVRIDKGCIYVVALNEKNAWRKARVEVKKLIESFKTKSN